MSSSETASPDTQVVAAPAAEAVGLTAGRAVLITVAFYAAQLVVGLGVGIGVGIYHAATRGALTPSAVRAIQQGVVLPAALLAIVAGGGTTLVFTWLTLRHSGDHAFRPLGWRSEPCGCAPGHARWCRPSRFTPDTTERS